MAFSILKQRDEFNDALHKELLLDYDSDYSGLPGLDKCAPGSEAVSIESGKRWVLKHNGAWDVKK